MFPKYQVLKQCVAGSQLDNLVFKIINSEGEVDRSIHSEDEHGQFHTLMLKSDSFDIDDSVRYNFQHGQCCIRSIRLPQRAGIFSFTAAHSRYPELNLNVEVATFPKPCFFFNDKSRMLMYVNTFM